MNHTPAAKIQRTRNTKGKLANAAVLKAATRLFAERGYEGVSIADIAAASGVAKPSVLYHFADKETLWKSAVDTLWAEVDTFFSDRWPRAMPASREKLETMLELFIEASITWPAYVRIPFIEGATQSWRSEWLADRHFGQHVMVADGILRNMQDEGLIGPGDPAHFQALLTSSINVLIAQSAMWNRTFSRGLSDPQNLRTMMTLILNLIVLTPLSDRTDK
jgi:TetR/AcrR family transcriptional regulator